MTSARAGDGLIRAIRKWDLVGLTINIIIGAGIFGLPGEVFARVGVYSLLAFAVCAAAVMLMVLCFAEVSSRFTGTGGPYLYAREAFGPLVGFEVGWLLWIARLTGFAANCNLFVSYQAAFMPSAGADAGRAITICVVVAGLTAVNVVGVRNVALVSNTFTIAKLAPLALFVGVGLLYVNPHAYTAASRPTAADFSLSVLLLVYAFGGFEMAVTAGGEAHDPRRDFPVALLLAIAVVALVYVLIQFVAIGTFPGLGTSSRPLTDAAGQFLGAAGAAVITAGALISILGNLNANLFLASRLPYAMAERGELPPGLKSTHHRFGTPVPALLVTAVLMLVLTLTGTFVYAVTISVIARLLSYGLTCLALPALRRRSDAPPPVFVAPGGVAIAIGALLIVAWLLSNVTAAQARDAAIAAAVGFLVYFASRRRTATAVAVENPEIPG